MGMTLKQIAPQSFATISEISLHPEEEHDWQITSGRPISGQKLYDLHGLFQRAASLE